MSDGTSNNMDSAQQSASDVFWHLKDGTLITKQKELQNLMNTSSHIKNVIYKPSKWKRTSDPRYNTIRNTIFERVSFSKTTISGIIFRNCTFTNSLFIGVAIKDCEFHNCTFNLTNTHKIFIQRTYIDPNSFKKSLIQHKHQNIGVHLYQALMRNSRETHQVEFERDAHFLFLRWKRFQEWYEIKNWPKADSTTKISKLIVLKYLQYLKRLVWEKFFGSGLRLRYFIVTVTLVIASFSMFNYFLRDALGLTLQEKPISSYLEAFYYTIISFTTLGYGDITPTTSWGQIVASAQSLVGFCLLALLVSMLFRRMSP